MKPQVLVVDDDPLLVMLLEHSLSAAGYRVRSAADGAAALESIRRDPPAIVILDAMLPVMGGAEVLRRLRDDGLLGAVKVVVLTTLSMEHHVVSMLKLGASDFLAKPFSPDELLARLERMIPAHAA
jgi:DNA-binding response OmpR family regulator